MQDKLHPYAIDKLLNWILLEEREGKIFGYYKDLFYQPSENDPFKMERYGQLLDTPLGVAAGPHTQLSQNIVLSWLFGARFIELKTVQVLDDIEVTKPCIDISDEGYNCEWSQELSVEESYNQYLDAWILLHILSDKFGYDFNTIFNISVGYDLKGIHSDKVKWFLSKIKDSSKELNEKVNQLSKIFPHILDLNIPNQISNNVTLSTMHGCPPEEIESIAKHLMNDWKFHTAVKLNPTILGKEKLSQILNDDLGYEITIPDEAYEHDMQFTDAKKLIDELSSVSKSAGVEFGLKLTNTLESLNQSELLPTEEKMVYMSGRALHPISANAAALLQNEYNGELDISFSGGADAFNISDIIACNLKPVTVCSDLLKPGGYSRLPQYLENLKEAMQFKNAYTINDFIIHKSNNQKLADAALSNLNNYAETVSNEKRYHQSTNKYKGIKTNRELTAFDCIHPPCVETCAISQNVPGYLFQTAKSNFSEAYKTIIEDNPLPNITGMVCDHLCQTKCTRMNIDNSILIREIKRFVSNRESSIFYKSRTHRASKRAAIIGAGPSGLSAAYFLGLNGVEVDVFDSKGFAGGMASSAIPEFRIDLMSLKKDIINIELLGVKFHYNETIDKDIFEKIKKDYDFIYIGVGAQVGKKLDVKGEENEGVYDQLSFLENVKRHDSLELGKTIAVIGGGNSAMDAARTAKRLVSGNSGNVTLIYRRTKNEMPADKEEVEALMEEGIDILELTAPVEITRIEDNNYLTCIRMQLGDLDSSGRRHPVEVPNSQFDLKFDSIITAVGQEVNIDFLSNVKLNVDPDTNETNLKNVYAGGDVIRGADTLINAISDGKNAANSILNKINGDQFRTTSEEKINLKEYQKKLSLRIYGEDMQSIPTNERDNFKLVNPIMDEEFAVNEASRCLYCDEICNICVSVCPNIANMYYEVEPAELKIPIIELEDGNIKVIDRKTIKVEQKYQIININDFCNECGNCETFCPTNGAPYKVKPKFALSQTSFDELKSGYFMKEDELLYKENGSLSKIKLNKREIIFTDYDFDITFDSAFKPIKAVQKSNNTIVNGEKIIEMYFYLINLKSTFINQQ